jgi:hypothetical protein
MMLADGERAALAWCVTAGEGSARALAHAPILKADGGPRGPVWTDAATSTVLDMSTSTVERLRKRYAELSLDAARGAQQ